MHPPTFRPAIISTHIYIRNNAANAWQSLKEWPFLLPNKSDKHVNCVEAAVNRIAQTNRKLERRCGWGYVCMYLRKLLFVQICGHPQQQQHKQNDSMRMSACVRHTYIYEVAKLWSAAKWYLCERLKRKWQQTTLAFFV